MRTRASVDENGRVTISEFPDPTPQEIADEAALLVSMAAEKARAVKAEAVTAVVEKRFAEDLAEEVAKRSSAVVPK